MNWYCRRYYRVTTCHSALSPLLDLSCALYNGHALRHVACATCALSLSLSSYCVALSLSLSLSSRALSLSLSCSTCTSLASFSRALVSQAPPRACSRLVSSRPHLASPRLRLLHSGVEARLLFAHSNCLANLLAS